MLQNIIEKFYLHTGGQKEAWVIFWRIHLSNIFQGAGQLKSSSLWLGWCRNFNICAPLLSLLLLFFCLFILANFTFPCNKWYMVHWPLQSITRWVHVQHYWLVHVTEQNVNLVHLVITRYIVITLHHALTLMHQLWPTEKERQWWLWPKIALRNLLWYWGHGFIPGQAERTQPFFLSWN